MTHEERAKRWRRLLLAGFGCCLAVLLFALLARQGIGIPCLFHKITGLLCPGCGNSRAALALLRLDFAGALQYNMLFPLEFFYLGWIIFFCCREYLKGNPFSYRPKHIWLDITVLILVATWWVLRNLI